MSNDAWSALQAEGVEATDAAPGGHTPAFTTTSVSGDTVLGFQLGTRLPDRCFKCADPSADQRLRLRITAHRDIVWRLSEAASGRVDWLSAPSRERLALELPYCQECLARRARATWFRILGMASPVLAIVLAGAITALTGANFGVMLILALVAAGALYVASTIMKSRTRVDVVDIDEDGFIRISGIHHDTAQEVVDAQAGGAV